MAEGNKTEKATAKKRRDERKKGNIFKSQDVISVATLVGAYAVIRIFAEDIVEQLTRYMTLSFGIASTPGVQLEEAGAELVIQAVMVLVKTTGVLLAVVILCGLVATLAQTRLLVSGESLKPKFSRINPLEGIRRLFSVRGVVEALKNIIKVIILLVLVYNTLRDMFSESSKYLYTDIASAVRYFFDITLSLIFRIILAYVVIAAADYFFQWWEYERQMKMTKQEVKEEYKQLEGNPQIKSKIREIQRRMAQSRMMQQVPQADVVIRNPTHFAVALRYDPEKDSAPVVLALGQDELALRIVKTAEENNVAVIENPPLARSLYANTELNKQIPPELYNAVAEVLVYIFKLNDDKRLENRLARK